MSVIYTVADKDPEVSKAFKLSIKEHPDLEEAEVAIDILFAAQEESDGSEPEPAVKLHGYPCAAVVKINPYKKRVEGLSDALIVVDKLWWDGAHDAERVAVLDHELTHLEVRCTGDGKPKLDAAGRPKLKVRLHDYQIGVFTSIIERHGWAAVDTRSVKQCVDQLGQAVMEFAKVG